MQGELDRVERLLDEGRDILAAKDGIARDERSRAETSLGRLLGAMRGAIDGAADEFARTREARRVLRAYATAAARRPPRAE